MSAAGAAGETGPPQLQVRTGVPRQRRGRCWQGWAGRAAGYRRPPGGGSGRRRRRPHADQRRRRERAPLRPGQQQDESGLPANQSPGLQSVQVCGWGLTFITLYAYIYFIGMGRMFDCFIRYPANTGYPAKQKQICNNALH